MGLPWRDHPSWSVVGQLSQATGRDLSHLLLEAPAEELRATRNAQVAAFGLSMVALDALLGELGGALPPGGPSGGLVAVAGHILGEYSALVASGALGAETAAVLVTERGEAMQQAAEAHPGTMAAVIGLDIELVAEACSSTEGAWVANDNTPGQVVVAGTPHGVAEAGAACLERGAKRVLPLQVGGAFHSPLMAGAQPRLNAALDRARFAEAAHLLVANVDATAHRSGFRDLLAAQLCSGVRWRQSLGTLAGLGATTFIELGPGTELSGMVRRCLPEARRANVAGPEDLSSALEALAAA